LPSLVGPPSIRLILWSFSNAYSPSIAPYDGHEDVYIVLDDFGSLGRAWRETAEAGADRATLVRNLLDGHYENPVRVVAFNSRKAGPVT
jgi:hypothetical protein